MIPGQPLREAVSWNAYIVLDKIAEAIVSLFVRLWVEMWNGILKKQMFRSASSWGCELKYELCKRVANEVPSASSWGCELKFWIDGQRYQMRDVSLFVRLWVEMENHTFPSPSASVSLFVRLWVEIVASLKEETGSQSASSWGCELKYGLRFSKIALTGQPLREAVSWNDWETVFAGLMVVSLFVRLWVEMYYRMNMKLTGAQSASSWGCELKWNNRVLWE